MKRISPCFEIGEQCRQIAGPFDHGTGGRLDIHAHLAGDDIRQRSLTQARRTVKKNMIEDVAAAPGGGNRYFQVLFNRFLPNVFIEAARPEIDFVAYFVVGLMPIDHGNLPSERLLARTLILSF